MNCAKSHHTWSMWSVCSDQQRHLPTYWGVQDSSPSYGTFPPAGMQAMVRADQKTISTLDKCILMLYLNVNPPHPYLLLHPMCSCLYLLDHASDLLNVCTTHKASYRESSNKHLSMSSNHEILFWSVDKVADSQSSIPLCSVAAVQLYSITSRCTACSTFDADCSRMIV